jgi:hypothetical protein
MLAYCCIQTMTISNVLKTISKVKIDCFRYYYMPMDEFVMCW